MTSPSTPATPAADTLWPLGRERAIALAAGSDLGEALTLVLEAAMEVPGVDGGGIYVVRPSGALNLVAHRGLGAEFIEQVSRYEPGSPGAALVAGLSPVFIDASASASNPSATTEFARREGLRAAACIPVARGGRAVAALNLASRTVDHFPDDIFGLLTDLATEVGAALVRIQAEDSLRASRRNLEQLFQAVDDCVFILGGDGRILHTNNATARLLQRPLEDLLGRPVLDLHPADRAEEAMQILQEMLSGTKSVCRIPLVNASGELVPVETRVTPGEWDGEPVLIGVSRDVGERDRMEAELRESREILQRVVEHSHVAAYQRDLRRDAYGYVSPVVERLLGYRASDMMNMTAVDVMERIHPGDHAAVLSVFERLKDPTMDRGSAEYRMRGADGVYRWISDRFEVHRDEAGEPCFLTGTVQDITAAHQSERALIASEARYRSTFESSRDALVVFDPSGIVDCNRAAVGMFGCEHRREMLGRPAEDFSAPEQYDGAPSSEAALHRAREASSPHAGPYPWRCRRADGSFFDADVQLSSLHYADRTVLMANVRDVTVRNQMVADLRESEARYRRLNSELRVALAERDAAQSRVDQLEGILPICSYCKKIREVDSTWHQMEEYISAHSSALFSHGVCPDCREAVLLEMGLGRQIGG